MKITKNEKDVTFIANIPEYRRHFEKDQDGNALFSLTFKLPEACMEEIKLPVLRKIGDKVKIKVSTEKTKL